MNNFKDLLMHELLKEESVQPTLGQLNLTGENAITENGTTTYIPEDYNFDGFSGVAVEVDVPSVASNLVSGSFKGTDSGAMDVDIPYNGNGFPLAVAIYPSSGYSIGTQIYELAQASAIAHFTGVKRNLDTPSYQNSGQNNMFVGCASYKTSTGPTLASSASHNKILLNGIDATQVAAFSVVAFKSNKKMSVYIGDSGYAFPANIDFTYRIIYSN